MRPKKSVALICSNEDALGILTFTLETWSLKVYRATTLLAAREIPQVDVFAIVLPVLDYYAHILNGIIDRRPDTPILLAGLQENSVRAAEHYGHAVVLGKLNAAEFRERIRVMVARKRGPKKREEATANAN